MRGSSGSKAVPLIVIALAIVLTPHLLSNVAAPGTIQPSTFLFHLQNTKTLNTVTTNLWANTTQAWPATGQTDQRTVSSSTPGVWHFYSQPALAGNVTFTGPLTFILYFSSSSGTGGGTVITGNVNKITSTGTVIPLAVGSLSGTSISTTMTAYTISLTSSTYQIEAGAIFDFQTTVSIGGSTSRTVSLYYDAPSDPSQVSITFQQRVGITTYSSFNQTGVQTGFFSRNWTLTGRQVSLKASIFDALGLYDLAWARANLTSPTGSNLLSNSAMTRITGTGLDYSGTWSLNWTYSANDKSGVYLSSLQALDNTGFSMSAQLSYTVLASWLLNLQAVSMDPIPVPVPGVSATLFVGSVAVYDGVADNTGWITPRNILLLDNSTYTLKGFWQGSLVNQTGAYRPKSSLSILLYLSVYSIDFSNKFLDGSSHQLPQPPSIMQLAYPNGTSSSLSPRGAYLLPAGTYSISSVTWKGVNVAASSITFNPKNGLSPVSLQIYDLTLLVIDQNGQALPGATVTLSLSGQMITQNTTGSNGILILHSLPKGQYVIAVTSQSQTVQSTLDLSQNTSSKIQFNAAPASWLTQSLGWIILGAGVGGLLGYGQFYRRKRPYKEEPFDYLDKLTNGGFRDGEVVLIEGDAKAGKTILCEEIAYRSLLSAHPVVYVTYDRSESVRQGMKAMHWDTSTYEAQEFFQLMDVELTKPQKMDRSFGVVENFYDTTVLDMTIASGLGQVKSDKPTLLVDSAHQMVERASLNGLINLVIATGRKVKDLKGRFFLSVSRTAPKLVLAQLEEQADVVLELATIGEGEQTFTQLTIAKMRGRKFDNRPVQVKIHQGRGIVFLVHKKRQHKRVPGPS